MTGGGGTAKPDSAAVVAVGPGEPDRVELGFGDPVPTAENVAYFASPPDVVGQPPNLLDVAPFVFPIT